MLTIVEHIEEVAGNLIKKIEAAFKADVSALEARIAALEGKAAPVAPVAPVDTKPTEPETK